jgi:hypothetical protein
VGESRSHHRGFSIQTPGRIFAAPRWRIITPGGDTENRGGSSFDVRRSTLDWDQGTIRSRGKRIFRDGPIIDYSKVVSSHSVFDGVSLPMLQRALSPRFFSLVDRALIKNLHASGTVVAATVATHGR